MGWYYRLMERNVSRASRGVAVLLALGFTVSAFSIVHADSPETTTASPSGGLIPTEPPSMPSSLHFTPVSLAEYPSFLDVIPGCFNPSGGVDAGLPVIDIKAMVPVSDKIDWLVVTESGTKNFRVVDRSKKGKDWFISERYFGSVSPKDKYTDLPVGKFNFKKGKKYKFEIHSGDLSSRRTPLLNYPSVKEKEIQISHCYGNR